MKRLPVRYWLNWIKEESEMMKLADIRQVYFIGIGGIGMSALARYFLSKGIAVSGYDKTTTVLTRELEAAGMEIVYEEKPETIPAMVDMVVYTPAIPTGNKILQHFKSKHQPLLKRSDVLQLISESSFNICIAGTHGKTTISTMTAHILRHSGYGCNAFLGGIAANYGTNFWSDERNVAVIEADEYDRSFLKLSPDIAVISAMDADHLDIYGTAKEMEKAFIAFAAKVKPGGVLFAQSGLERGGELEAPRKFTYALQNKTADITASGISAKEGAYHFSVVSGSWNLENVTLNMGGLHNVENSLVAIAIAHELGIEDNRIREAVSAFRGVKRRFEYKLKTDRFTYVDDYAHHPEELKALINGARDMFKGKKCTVIFQPHLFSRTRDFAEGFAKSLDLADEVILLPIYPAREEPIPGVDSKMISALMKGTNRVMDNKESVLQWVDENEPELLITAGAGDIDQLTEKITNTLRKK
jgi:UDP-N-acetylmuramate--alanine ligase